MKPRHRYPLLGLLSAVLLQPACKPKAATPAQLPRQAKGLGFALSYDPVLFSASKVTQDTRLTMQENGSDIPLDVGPARAHFAFTAIPAAIMRGKDSHDYDLAGHLTVIPLQDASVPDYDQAYPAIRPNVESLRSLLAQRPKTVPVASSLPDLNPVEAAQSLHAKLAYLDSPWYSGVFFITRYEQDSAAIKGDELSVVFQGLSKDGKYYITGDLPVGQRALLKLPVPDDKEIEAHYEAYLRDIEAILNQAGDASFSPDLGELKAMFLSLHPER